MTISDKSIARRLVAKCVAVSLIGVVCSESAAMRCQDFFSDKTPEIYNKDFGPGLFIQRLGNTRFHIEPPPHVADSVRNAQLKVRESATSNRDDKFTVTFKGFSEMEVLGFKEMLRRDARIQADTRLSTVLLATEKVDSSENPGYERSREHALLVRDHMLRRYDWTKASVSREPVNAGHPLETYRLAVEKAGESDGFLLSLHLKAFRFVKDRTKRLKELLSRNSLHNATVEQLAQSVISELKKSDKGITDGTLKVMAADFLISRADRLTSQ